MQALLTVPSHADKGLAVANETAAAEKEPEEKHKGKKGNGRRAYEEEQDSSDDEDEQAQLLANKDKDGLEMPDDEGPEIPLGKDGKPMNEIDLYMYRATEEKRRQSRIARSPCLFDADGRMSYCSVQNKRNGAAT